MSTIVQDVTVLPERVKRELIRGENARAEFAIRAQTALKEAMDEMGPVRHIDGLGVRRATIAPDLAARIRVKFKRADGFDPLHDPDFLKVLLRENPFLRVQCVPGRLTLRVNGLKAEPRKEDGARRGRRKDENSERLEEGQNQGNAGQHSAQPRLEEPRGPRGEPATPFLEYDPVIKQTAGVSLVLSPAILHPPSSILAGGEAPCA